MMWKMFFLLLISKIIIPTLSGMSCLHFITFTSVTTITKKGNACNKFLDLRIEKKTTFFFNILIFVTYTKLINTFFDRSSTFIGILEL